MTFNFAVAGEKYDRFMGRYLPTLSVAFADAAGVHAGMSVLDVGCGPGGLTRELVDRVGAEAVAAIDPSPPFVEATRERFPGVDVREGGAEEMPFEDDAFDAALASLVVAFMQDADAGIAEMSRVTKPGGVVAACMWDVADGMTMLRVMSEARKAVLPEAPVAEPLRGTREGELGRLLRAQGLTDVEESVISASASYEDFDDWWEPFTYGIGPHSGRLMSLSDEQRTAVRDACREGLGNPDGAFTLDARAWFARGRVAA
jgi:SAM-dependent methyltransferase